MLRRLSITAGVLLLGLPALADYTTSITDTINLSVQGAAIDMQRVGNSYSVSGSGVTIPTTGTPAVVGGGISSATGDSTSFTPTDWTQTTSGGAFSFSESMTIGDAVPSATAGTVGTCTSSPCTYTTLATPIFGDATVQFEGSAGSLAGTLSPGGVGSITAGGPGTSATAQRTVTLTVFE